VTSFSSLWISQNFLIYNNRYVQTTYTILQSVHNIFQNFQRTFLVARLKCIL